MTAKGEWIPERWTFRNKKVAANFERHVREQLPWYDLVTRSLTFIGAHYIPRGGLVYDVGASTGNVSRALAPILKDRGAKLVAVEESDEMRRHYDGPGELRIADAMTFEFEPFDFCVVFLTAMFLPVDGRGALLHRLHRLTKPGGALVVLDKMSSDAGYAGTVMRRMTMQWKLDTGTPAEEIVAKELSLAGVQRPLDSSALPPGGVPFFRFGEFAGWLFENAERSPS